MYTFFTTGAKRKRITGQNKFWWDWLDGANSRWYPLTLPMTAASLTTGTIGPDVAQMLIFKAPNRDVTITGLGIEVTTAVAARLANIAIYDIPAGVLNSQSIAPFVTGENLGEVDALDCSILGARTGACSIPIKKNRAYVAILLSGGGAGSMTLRALNGVQLQGVGISGLFGTVVGCWPWWGSVAFGMVTPMPAGWPWTAGLSVNFTMAGRGVTPANPPLIYATFT